MIQDNKAWLQNNCLPRVIHTLHYITHVWAWLMLEKFTLIHKFLLLKQYDLKGQHFSSDKEIKIKNSKHVFSLSFTAEISAKQQLCQHKPNSAKISKVELSRKRA